MSSSVRVCTARMTHSARPRSDGTCLSTKFLRRATTGAVTRGYWAAKVKHTVENPVYTIGHSTRAIEDYLNLLHKYRIMTVVDVRTIPKSRHNPQYNEDALRSSLSKSNVAYIHFKGLGGLRRTTPDSVNTAWRNLSFRGYADYMQTVEFAESLEKLMTLAAESQTVIMCAEAVPWRCHRSLIGDALLIRGIVVEDIISESSCKPHKLTPFAKVEGNEITYPALP